MTQPLPSHLPTTPSWIGVARVRGEFRLVAQVPIEVGEVVFHMEGRIADRPSRYTVQVGAEEHLDPWEAHDLTWVLDHRPYAFMNHSCAPNARIVDRDVVAHRRIERGDEVTFDYRTTERIMREPFLCRCGHCEESWIRGYAFLSPEERRALEPLLARHAHE